jgi:drug/metabolite transporter (DMT)-like permease
MFFAAAVLTPFALYYLRKLKSIKDLLMLAIVGFSGNFFPAYLFTFAETGISSGYTGMLNSFTPIFALIIGFVIFRNRLTPIQIVGVIIGTIGIVLLSVAGHNLSVNGTFWHIGAVVIATLFYAISLNTIKFTLQHYSGMMITSIAFFLLLLPSLISNWYSGTWSEIVSNPNANEGLFFIGILSVVGTAFAVYLFNLLIAKASVLFSSSVTYLIPIVAVFIGLVYGERINLFQVLSMLVILVGIFVANVIPKIRKKGNV